jgi:hypothetical protein
VIELQLADLHMFESQQLYQSEEPVILSRKHAVLISFSPLRAIVMADKLMMIVPKGADSLLYLFQENFQSIIEMESRHSTAYRHQLPEVSAYKALLSTVLALHQQVTSCTVSGCLCAQQLMAWVCERRSNWRWSAKCRES